MQSFPSSLKNDGRAAFTRTNNATKNKKEVMHTYAPKYAQNELTQEIRKSYTSNESITCEPNNKLLVYRQRENKKENNIKQQLIYNNKNKRRANSAISYNNNKFNENDDTNLPIKVDFSVESFLKSIKIESEIKEEAHVKPKRIKKESNTAETSSQDPSNIYAALPKKLVKANEKKKTESKTLSPSKSFDYDHLNGRELYHFSPNMEKFFTRLTKESRKDAVLQRSILARYSQNQVQYIGINKEKKKSVTADKLSISIKGNNNSIISNEKRNSDVSDPKALTDDAYEFSFNSEPNSSRNTQQNQKNKQTFNENEDKFSHLNCRMTTLINYNDLSKTQTKYTRKVKDTNNFNKTIKKDDDPNDSDTSVIPPRLFFSRAPLFDDPENPKQRETQEILSKSMPREQSSSRSSSLDSNKRNENQMKNRNSNEFTPHTVLNKQNLGPTPQSRAISRTRSIPSSPHQRPIISNLSIVSPNIVVSTPHSQSGHISSRKGSLSSLSSMKSSNKRNKPPIIPNSKLNSTSKSAASANDICDAKSNSTNSSNSNINYTIIPYLSDQPKNNFNKTAPLARPRQKKDINNPKYTRKSLNSEDSLFENDLDSLNDDNLIAKPRARHPRRSSALHRSLLVGGDNSKIVPSLLKLQNLSDNTSPATPSSSAMPTNRSQNAPNKGVFKLNPILPKKVKPKEEKAVETEEIEKSDKTKPVDSITFQMTALEKFKKEKKRKKMEENGFYYYKKESKQNKDDQSKSEQTKNQTNEEDKSVINENKGNENPNDENNDISNAFPIDANAISNDDENQPLLIDGSENKENDTDKNESDIKD